jgi:hypothetical protein
MSMRYLLDEHLRGPLWHAIHGHNSRGINVIDVTRVGDPADLPLGSLDPDILCWAEREGRILVTADRESMVGYLADHLRAGRHSPGIFVLRPLYKVSAVVDALVLAAHAGDPMALWDRFDFIPFP